MTPATKAALLVVCVCVAAMSAGCDGQSISDPGTTYNSSQPPRATSYVTNSYAFDIDDLRRLAGFADAVFIGKVIGQQGSKALNSFPETQFRVEVLSTLKGRVDQTVTVNQFGGVDGRTQQVILDEGDRLIEPGQTYLFVTRYLPSEDWYTAAPIVTSRKLTEREAQAAANPRSTVGQAELVVDMRAAIVDQIPFP